MTFRFASAARTCGSALVAVLVVALRARQAAAQASEANVVLTRARAIELGLAQGPGVAIEQAARGGVAHARGVANPLLLAPPRITVTAGRRTGTFGQGLEVGVTALEEFSTRRLGKAREQTAEALQRLAERSVESARLESATRAGLAWATAVEAKSVLALRETSLRDADALLRGARLRVTSGVGQPIEVAVASGERGAAAAFVLDAEGALTEALFELRYATGLDADTVLDAEGQLEAIPPLQHDAARLVRRANEGHPTLAAVAARADVARHDEQLTHALHAPTFGLGVSYLHEGTGNEVWSGVVAVPLPFGDFGAFDRARQQITADRASAEAQQLRRQLARDVRLALHEREHARETYEAFVSGARAPMQEALRLARVQYEAGPGEISAVLLARQRLTAAEEQIVRAAANVHRADIHLASASGTLLVKEAP